MKKIGMFAVGLLWGVMAFADDSHCEEDGVFLSCDSFAQIISNGDKYNYSLNVGTPTANSVSKPAFWAPSYLNGTSISANLSQDSFASDVVTSERKKFVVSYTRSEPDAKELYIMMDVYYGKHDEFSSPRKLINTLTVHVKPYVIRDNVDSYQKGSFYFKYYVNADMNKYKARYVIETSSPMSSHMTVVQLTCNKATSNEASFRVAYDSNFVSMVAMGDSSAGKYCSSTDVTGK